MPPPAPRPQPPAHQVGVPWAGHKQPLTASAPRRFPVSNNPRLIARLLQLEEAAAADGWLA